MSQPTHRHLLISVLGRTPQILTETLYALGVVRKIPISEIWVISTQEGQREAIDRLLHPEAGHFHQLKRDYPEALAPAVFTPTHILVARDGLLQVADIRQREHSEAFLELIMRVLWEKTALPEVALHCSLAGGRKTMSTYLALALQLLARPQDRLYHVLVDPPELENHPDFFYPPRKRKWLTLPQGRRVDSRQARVHLVDIPFIRLRERLPLSGRTTAVGYRQLLEWVQAEIDQAIALPALRLNLRHCTLQVGGTSIRLQPQRFCLYWYFAERSRRRPKRARLEDYPAYFEPAQSPYFSHVLRDGLLHNFDSLDPGGGMRRHFVDKVLDHGELPMSWVLQAIARINAQIRLGVANAYWVPFYLISAEGRRNCKYYGIKIDGQKILLEP
ncbi:MAG: hypothetical protein DKINENOH_04833 [bacterium]|nr:hypothetical protein [bacterium]